MDQPQLYHTSLPQLYIGMYRPFGQHPTNRTLELEPRIAVHHGIWRELLRNSIETHDDGKGVLFLPLPRKARGSPKWRPPGFGVSWIKTIGWLFDPLSVTIQPVPKKMRLQMFVEQIEILDDASYSKKFVAN